MKERRGSKRRRVCGAEVTRDPASQGGRDGGRKQEDGAGLISRLRNNEEPSQLALLARSATPAERPMAITTSSFYLRHWRETAPEVATPFSRGPAPPRASFLLDPAPSPATANQKDRKEGCPATGGGTAREPRLLAEMLRTEKVLLLRSLQGRSVRVVREHYLRPDVPCGSALCRAGCPRGALRAGAELRGGGTAVRGIGWSWERRSRPSRAWAGLPNARVGGAREGRSHGEVSCLISKY